MIPVPVFAGKAVAVLGLGRSGLPAARSLAAGGAKVGLWDDDPRAREAAEGVGLPFVDLSVANLSKFAALVVSPGIPVSRQVNPIVRRAREAAIPVLNDIELFARAAAVAPAHRRPKIAAITGTNGKSTTSALLAHLLAEVGRDVRLGGNIGVGVLGLDDMHGGAVYVLELSSYQLELAQSLKADVAAILNLSPDHLDRHGTMADYVAAKKRIFLNQGKGDHAVVGVDDPWCQQICTEITAANRRTIWPISSGRAMGRGVYALQGVLYDASDGGRVAEVADLTRARALTGRHNHQNAAAAYAMARALGLSGADAAAGLMSFPGLAHRMENVGAIGKVRFINDSKATNADAARAAMSSYPRFHWLVGGRAKTGGIAPLADLFPRVERAYLFGEAQEEFAAALEGKAPLMRCGTLEAAVEAAYAAARSEPEGALVLFSPASASFDRYADFEERGEAFRAAVHALAQPRRREATA